MARPPDRISPDSRSSEARPSEARPSEARRFWIGLSVITLIALAWRVYYVIDQHVFCGSGSRNAFLPSPQCNTGRLLLNGDAAYYHWEANLVAKGFGFIDPTRYELFGMKTPSAGHPPAYMIYLAGVSRFIGTSQLTHRLASTLLGAGAVFMIGVLARHIFKNDWAGWIAALLAAGYANLWINDEMLMSESMYVLATAVAVLLAYRFWDTPKIRTAVFMGLGIAFAALSRAEAISLFPFLAIPFAFLVTRRDGRGIKWKRGAKYALVSCVAGGLLMLPWVAYNSTRFEHPVVLSNGTGSVLMTGNCDSWVPRDAPQDAGAYRGTYFGNYVGYWSIYCSGGLDARLDHFYSPEKAKYYKEQLGNIPGTDVNFFGDESTHEVAWRAVGTAEIKDHLRQMPRVILLRIARMWDFFRPRQNMFLNGVLEGRGYWQSRLATYEYYPLLALSIGGLVLLRRRRVPILPFLAIALTITITAATSFGITRYRAPVDAMLPVLAGGALAWLFAQAAAWLRRQGGARATGPHSVMTSSDSPYAATSQLLADLLNDRRFRSGEFLDWFYGANPRGRAIVEDIDDDSGRRVGHYAVLPTTYRTPAGTTPFIFTSNVATDPSARRKGLFREMAERIYPRAAATGAPGLAGTSNAQSSVVIVNRFGWKDLGSMPAVFTVPLVWPRGVRDIPVDDAFLASGEFTALVSDLDWVPVRDWVQSWSADFLRWRLRNPDNTYTLHVGSDAMAVSARDHGPLHIPAAVLCKVFPRPGAALPVHAGRYVSAACHAHRAPVCVYGGWNAHVRVRGIAVPERFRPSPLVVVFKSFDEERAPTADFRLDTWEFLDGDAY